MHNFAMFGFKNKIGQICFHFCLNESADPTCQSGPFHCIKCRYGFIFLTSSSFFNLFFHRDRMYGFALSLKAHFPCHFECLQHD